MSSPNKNDTTKSHDDDDGICEVNDMLQNMKTADVEETDISVCANCGKEGSDVNNTCNKCKSVKYCNAACKKKHRHKHKKECEKRVAELHDEKLFKLPPLQYEDCPICFLRMPSLEGGMYKSCCGKVICSGCVHAVRMKDGDVGLCPFCRVPAPTSNEEDIIRLNKRVEVGDATAIGNMGFYYSQGQSGLPQNHAKALELWHRAGELGCTDAYYNIGNVFYFGRGAEVDKKKAIHYYEQGAMLGDVNARHNLGGLECNVGNIERALKHWMISVAGGDADSLNKVQQLYSNGLATKEDYSNALRSYQEYLNEVKSVQRDEAAAYKEDYKYID